MERASCLRNRHHHYRMVWSYRKSFICLNAFLWQVLRALLFATLLPAFSTSWVAPLLASIPGEHKQLEYCAELNKNLSTFLTCKYDIDQLKSLQGLFFILYLFFLGYPAWGKLARHWLLSNNPKKNEEKDPVKNDWGLPTCGSNNGQCSERWKIF